MEIAHALERKGRKGFLYMVDSSPKIVKWISKMLFNDRGFFTNLMAFTRALNSGVNLQKVKKPCCLLIQLFMQYNLNFTLRMLAHYIFVSS